MPNIPRVKNGDIIKPAQNGNVKKAAKKLNKKTSLRNVRPDSEPFYTVIKEAVNHNCVEAACDYDYLDRSLFLAGARERYDYDVYKSLLNESVASTELDNLLSRIAAPSTPALPDTFVRKALRLIGKTNPQVLDPPDRTVKYVEGIKNLTKEYGGQVLHDLLIHCNISTPQGLDLLGNIIQDDQVPERAHIAFLHHAKTHGLTPNQFLHPILNNEQNPDKIARALQVVAKKYKEDPSNLDILYTHIIRDYAKDDGGTINSKKPIRALIQDGYELRPTAASTLIGHNFNDLLHLFVNQNAISSDAAPKVLDYLGEDLHDRQRAKLSAKIV